MSASPVAFLLLLPLRAKKKRAAAQEAKKRQDLKRATANEKKFATRKFLPNCRSSPSFATARGPQHAKIGI
jgi:hypothetical protein